MRGVPAWVGPGGRAGDGPLFLPDSALTRECQPDGHKGQPSDPSLTLQEADFFYVPVYTSCLIMPVQNFGDGPYYHSPLSCGCGRRGGGQGWCNAPQKPARCCGRVCPARSSGGAPPPPPRPWG